jgi:hypothetical protein
METARLPANPHFHQMTFGTPFSSFSFHLFELLPIAA